MFFDIWTFELVPDGRERPSVRSTATSATATNPSGWCSTRIRKPAGRAARDALRRVRGSVARVAELRIRHFHKVLDDYIYGPGGRPPDAV